MKRHLLLTLTMLAAALPAFAVERHQSFISYDEGGTVVRSGEDGEEIEAKRNLPVYPDDEIITARRGRTEVRLSDGNIVGIDRATALRFRSILDSYEGEAEETIAELRYGKVAIFRTDLGRDRVRLDTENASYVAEYESIYSVEADSRGRDYVKVFEGSVEVRTPSRSTSLRAGEAADVDERGVNELAGGQRAVSDEFERWFIGRAERFSESSSRYVDRRLLYYADDLDDYGSWVSVSGIGYAWRPTVSVGWRPYYRGYWHRSRFGCLTWVSYDPWGWGTYHYGRWAYDPFHGWIWVPGYGYSPAWVYWWHGSGYVGWAPSGWWDCHRGYYDWAYRPYRTRGVDFGFGFYGRVRVNEMDLRPWTFVDSRGLISNRIDRAALTTDAVKQRLGRSGGTATITSGAARFTNEDLRDPAEAIRRRALDGREGRLTGRETGAGSTTADLTPFFKRDAGVSGVIRDRIVRSGGATPATGTTTPRTGGSAGTIGRGSTGPSTPGGSVDRGRDGATSGRIERGTGSSGSGSGSSGSTSGSVRGSAPSGGSTWRGGDSGGSRGTIERDAGTDRSGSGGSIRSGSSGSGTVPPAGTSRRESWRGRDAAGDSGSGASRGSSDVPRRVIDRIGGARIVPRDTSARDSDRSGSSDRPARVQSGSSSGRSRSASSGSGSSGRSGGSSARSGGSSSGSSGSGRASSGSGSKGSGSSGSSSSGGNRSGGGRIGRNQ